MAGSEPEPDVSVIRGLREGYIERHAGPDAIGLLVEVADTSVERDRNWKKRMYAAAGIPVYWIVDLVDSRVDVFTGPSGETENADFATHQVFRMGEVIKNTDSRTLNCQSLATLSLPKNKEQPRSGAST